MPANTTTAPIIVAVIGAGPAGLMAAEQAVQAGFAVEVFDAMPSVARKFLLAGIGGMNITHAEKYSAFLSRYGMATENLKPIIDELTPDTLREWIHGLGIETFVGTSHRVFPTDMKAAPLLRRWLHKLRQQGVTFHPRHRWLDFGETTLHCRFANEGKEFEKKFDAVLFALGGASWARLGSDGSWVTPFIHAGVDVAPLQPSNCGFEINWSDYIRQRHAGDALKNVRLFIQPGDTTVAEKHGEFVLTQYGVEGSAVYALSAQIRETLNNTTSSPALYLDWLPALTHSTIAETLSAPRKGMTLSNLLRKKFKLPPACLALLKESIAADSFSSPASLAHALKAMPLNVTAPRPIDEAISSAGGIRFSELNDNLMLKKLPGVFVAGEMLDWEAPTGGYLLTACFATGKRAGQGIATWLHRKTEQP